MAVILAGIAQLVERWLPKPKAAGSSPVSRSIYHIYYEKLLANPKVYQLHLLPLT